MSEPTAPPPKAAPESKDLFAEVDRTVPRGRDELLRDANIRPATGGPAKLPPLVEPRPAWRAFFVRLAAKLRLIRPR